MPKRLKTKSYWSIKPLGVDTVQLLELRMTFKDGEWSGHNWGRTVRTKDEDPTKEASRYDWEPTKEKALDRLISLETHAIKRYRDRIMWAKRSIVEAKKLIMKSKKNA